MHVHHWAKLVPDGTLVTGYASGIGDGYGYGTGYGDGCGGYG